MKCCIQLNKQAKPRRDFHKLELNFWITLQSSLPETSMEGSVLEKSTLQARFSCSSYSITLCSRLMIHQWTKIRNIMPKLFYSCQIDHNDSPSYLTSGYIPNSYNSFIVTASYVVLCIFVPTQATKFWACRHLNNRTVCVWRFINNLESHKTQSYYANTHNWLTWHKTTEKKIITITITFDNQPPSNLVNSWGKKI